MGTCWPRLALTQALHYTPETLTSLYTRNLAFMSKNKQVKKFSNMSYSSSSAHLRGTLIIHIFKNDLVESSNPNKLL